MYACAVDDLGAIRSYTYIDTLDCLDNTNKLLTQFSSTVKTEAASTGIQL